MNNEELMNCTIEKFADTITLDLKVRTGAPIPKATTYSDCFLSKYSGLWMPKVATWTSPTIEIRSTYVDGDLTVDVLWNEAKYPSQMIRFAMDSETAIMIANTFFRRMYDEGTL